MRREPLFEFMEPPAEQNYRKFLTLRNIALAINSPATIGEIAREALAQAVAIVGVEAGLVTILDAKGQQVSQAIAGGEEKKRLLLELESELLISLRKNFGVRSVYLTLDRDGTHTLFSYPLRSNGEVVGAISGVVSGTRNLALEEEFIEALGHQLGIAVGKKVILPTLVKTERPAIVQEFLDYSLDLKQVLTRLHEKLSPRVKYDLVGLVHPRDAVWVDLYLLRRGAGEVLEGRLERIEKTLLEQVASRRTPVLTNRVGETGLHAQVRGLQYVGLVPLVFENDVVGVVYLGAAGMLTQPDLEELRALALPLALAVKNALLYGELRAAYQTLSERQKELLKDERKTAVLEAAVTISHEVNNPLTAVLGNTQLLLLKKEQFPPEVQEKLKVIEESALRIREVTQKLMNIEEPVSTEYVEGVKMLDLEKSMRRKKE